MIPVRAVFAAGQRRAFSASVRNVSPPPSPSLSYAPPPLISNPTVCADDAISTMSMALKHGMGMRTRMRTGVRNEMRIDNRVI